MTRKTYLSSVEPQARTEKLSVGIPEVGSALPFERKPRGDGRPREQEPGRNLTDSRYPTSSRARIVSLRTVSRSTKSVRTS